MVLLCKTFIAFWGEVIITFFWLYIFFEIGHLAKIRNLDLNGKGYKQKRPLFG